MSIMVSSSNLCELINIKSINPLVSRCEIKVCYVGDEPNRNHSVITKEVAKKMAETLPGCPIVGFFSKEADDFREHSKSINIDNGKFEIVDKTRPYGFVDLNARAWFQNFTDGGVEHEYLMTEGLLWSKIYPETQRILEGKRGQSMELAEDLLQGDWTENDKGEPQFFIINEAVFEKLCILGEDVEPCFEGAAIATHFSLDSEFKENLFTMIKDIQLALKEGGTAPMEIEDKVVEGEFKKTTPEEEEKQKTDEMTPEEKKAEEERKKKLLEESKCGEKKKKNYELEEIPEYTELALNFSALQAKYDSLEAELAPLRKFKNDSELVQKQDMIKSFYMLSDTDKKDVTDNIQNYSLGDIESKLSVICVRNKVSFNLEEDKKPQEPIVYTLDDNDASGDDAPAWIKAVRDTAKTMN